MGFLYVLDCLGKPVEGWPLQVHAGRTSSHELSNLERIACHCVRSCLRESNACMEHGALERIEQHWRGLNSTGTGTGKD